MGLSSAAVFQSKDGGRDVGQIETRGAAVRVELGEGVHRSEYATGPFRAGDYGRTYRVRLPILGVKLRPEPFFSQSAEIQARGIFFDSGQAFQDGDFTGPR